MSGTDGKIPDKMPFSVLMDAELLKKFRIAALANGLSATKVARILIERYVAEHPVRLEDRTDGDR